LSNQSLVWELRKKKQPSRQKLDCRSPLIDAKRRRWVVHEYDTQNDFSLLRESEIEENCYCRGELLSTDGSTFELTYKGHEMVYKHLRLTLKEGTNEDK
jgi:hypothetical protein